jgi:hypothetical protein
MSEQVENQHPFRTCIHGHDLDWSPCEFCIESIRNRRTVMKHSWLRAPSGFLYCRNCLLVCQWPLVRSDDDCGYQAETGAEHE